MRMLLTFKLRNGEILGAVANQSTKEKAKNWVIKNCDRLLSEQGVNASTSMEFISSENWESERAAYYQDGYKEYIVAFNLDEVKQSIKIYAPGIKSAYNNVKIKYGIQDDIDAVIYELNQEVEKKLARSVTNNLIKNLSKLDEFLVKTKEKIRDIQIDRSYIMGLYSVIDIIYNTAHGKYRCTATNTVMSMIDCLVYYNDPVGLDLGMSEAPCADGTTSVLIWMLKCVRPELTRYKQWQAFQNYARGKKCE